MEERSAIVFVFSCFELPPSEADYMINQVFEQAGKYARATPHQGTAGK
jgi:hypothetical protein